MRVNPFGRPRHKKPAFLRFLEYQEIFRNFGDFKEKMGFWAGIFRRFGTKNCFVFFAVLFKIPME